MVDALRHAVDEGLTEHQRRIFVAVVLNAVPLEGYFDDPEAGSS